MEIKSIKMTKHIPTYLFTVLQSHCFPQSFPIFIPIIVIVDPAARHSSYFCVSPLSYH